MRFGGPLGLAAPTHPNTYSTVHTYPKLCRRSGNPIHTRKALYAIFTKITKNNP